MIVRLMLSAAARRKLLVEQGQEVPANHDLTPPLVELTPASREVLADLPSAGPYYWLRLSPRGADYYVDAIPESAADWDKLLSAYAAVRTAALQAYAEQEERSRGEAANRAAESAAQYLAGGVNIPWGDAMQRLSGPTRQAVVAEEARRLEAAAQREAAEATAKAAHLQERLDWITAHGSDHLRAAVGAGHNCQRLYATERAAIEYPGYDVDFDDNCRWSDRSCPSPDALAEALRVEGQVVWLTHGLAAAPDDSDEEEYPESYEAREAVLIREYLDKYDLVRTEFSGGEETETRPRTIVLRVSESKYGEIAQSADEAGMGIGQYLLRERAIPAE